MRDYDHRFPAVKDEIRFMVLDPGHFHAALVQKKMYDQVSPQVFVYAPKGDEVNDYLKRIEQYNTRLENPTNWLVNAFLGRGFFETFLGELPGNVLILSGNNKKKTEYLKTAVQSGVHIFADKPMAINTADFQRLEEAFQIADESGLLIYDIMTERFEITTILQKELSQIPGIFGKLINGTPDYPAITKESVHHFFKYVSGKKLKRPGWFFDVTQQGEGTVDVTTHLVDLIQWECFPGEVIDYRKDIKLISAERWPTKISVEQFKEVTQLDTIPHYLARDLDFDKIFHLYTNGMIQYRIKGVHAQVSVTWKYKAPEGTGDTHYSIMRGTKADLVIRQGKPEKYKPVLYIEPPVEADKRAYEKELNKAFKTITEKYPGVYLKEDNPGWIVVIPDRYKVGHEAHFAQVTENFISYLLEGELPEWEIPNMITKYYITTHAWKMALGFE